MGRILEKLWPTRAVVFASGIFPTTQSNETWSLDPAMKADEIPNKQWAGPRSLSPVVCIRLSAPDFSLSGSPRTVLAPELGSSSRWVVVATIEIEGHIDAPTTFQYLLCRSR